MTARQSGSYGLKQIANDYANGCDYFFTLGEERGTMQEHVPQSGHLSFSIKPPFEYSFSEGA